MAAAFFAVLLLFCIYFEETLSVGCSGSAIDGERRQLLQILDPLKAYGFIIQDQHSVNEYTVHLCNNPFSQAAVWQRNLVNDTGDRVVLGVQNDTRVVKGSEHMIITFGSGQTYTSGLCEGHKRSAIIILTCVHDKLHGNVRHVKESVGRDQSNCYFLFEFETSVVCNSTKQSSFPNALFSVFFAVSVGGALIAMMVLLIVYKASGSCLLGSMQTFYDKLNAAIVRRKSEEFGAKYDRFNSSATINQANMEI